MITYIFWIIIAMWIIPAILAWKRAAPEIIAVIATFFSLVTFTLVLIMIDLTY